MADASVANNPLVRAAVAAWSERQSFAPGWQKVHLTFYALPDGNGVEIRKISLQQTSVKEPLND